MKTILTTLILVGIIGFSYGQTDYKVIKVNGSITMKSSGKNLSTGTVFSDRENLLFGQPTAKAAVINPEKGRFVVTPENANDLTNSKSNFIPGLSNISSRSGASSLRNIVDMKNYFSGNFMIFDSTTIVINSPDFPIDENNFFYCRYKYNDEDVNKKLEYLGDTVIIYKNELLSILGNPISSEDVTEMQLFYYQQNEKKSVLINSFNPVFAEKSLKEEIQVIIDELSSKTFKEKYDAIVSYLNEFYGKPDESNLKNWLKTEFNLEQK
ncbi:MAG: hypothetical protein JXR58_04150 [Bacteroidales bacterium]|nr:hypothetical protein [Bacteroidales bacterium]